MSATVVVVDLHVAADKQASKPTRRRMLKRIALMHFLCLCLDGSLLLFAREKRTKVCNASNIRLHETETLSYEYVYMKEYEYLCAHSADWCASRMCKSRCCLIDTQSPLYIFTRHTEVSIDRSLFPTYVFYLRILHIQILFHIRHIRSGSAVMRSSNRFVLFHCLCCLPRVSRSLRVRSLCVCDPNDLNSVLVQCAQKRPERQTDREGACLSHTTSTTQ